MTVEEKAIKYVDSISKKCIQEFFVSASSVMLTVGLMMMIMVMNIQLTFGEILLLAFLVYLKSMGAAKCKRIIVHEREAIEDEFIAFAKENRHAEGVERYIADFLERVSESSHHTLKDVIRTINPPKNDEDDKE